MGKILYMGYNGYGHVYPSLSLVKSLVDNGNEVIYLNSKEFKNIIEQTGAKYVRNRFLDLLYEIADMESVKMEKMTEEEYFCGVENFYGQLGNILKILLELKKVIVSMNPDLILYDSSAKIVGYFCSDLKIPRVCVFTFFATNKEMMLKDERLWAEFQHCVMSSPMKSVLDRVECMAKKGEKKYGFYYDNLDMEESKCSMNLVFTSRQFQPYHDCLDDSYYYIGNDTSFRRSMEETFIIDSYYEKKILLSFGSILCGKNEYIKFYQDFMDYFKNYPACFILNIGKMDEHSFSHVPDNFKLVHHIPQLTVLAQVQDMDELLYKPEYKENLKKLAQSYKNTGMNEYAVKLIEEYMYA